MGNFLQKKSYKNKELHELTKNRNELVESKNNILSRNNKESFDNRDCEVCSMCCKLGTYNSGLTVVHVLACGVRIWLHQLYGLCGERGRVVMHRLQTPEMCR